MAKLKGIPVDKRVYIDESGIDQFISREYGWEKRGLRVFGDICGKRYQRESILAAKLGQRILAPFCFQGTCDTVLFNLWLEKVLLPELEPGYTLIMDNATFHKSAATLHLIEQAGCQLLFLPPYSPDLNPIEKYWAQFKSRIRGIVDQFTSLSEAIDYVFINGQ
jgi:hypothetical protein